MAVYKFLFYKIDIFNYLEGVIQSWNKIQNKTDSFKNVECYSVFKYNNDQHGKKKGNLDNILSRN